LRHPAAGEITPRAPTAAGVTADCRKRRADNDCLLRARLLQAVQGDFERGTGADGALDQ
jgi:hypothetical protein